jgi:hypothetical protein
MRESDIIPSPNDFIFYTTDDGVVNISVIFYVMKRSG